MRDDPHAIWSEDENGNRVAQIAWVKPAEQKDVDYLLSQTEGDLDGRSAWQWVRMQDGTLMLAVFPQGDTYEDLSQGGVCDYEHAVNEEGAEA